MMRKKIDKGRELINRAVTKCVKLYIKKYKLKIKII